MNQLKLKKHSLQRAIKFDRLKPWHLLVPALFFLIIGIAALRQNNFTMITLRDNVIKTDQDNGDVEKSLQELRKHVYGHMNTNLSSGNNSIKPPIQLKARYDRLNSAEQERIKQANAQTTVTAESKCSAQYPVGGFNAPRVACVQEYMRVNGIAVNTVPDSLYKFDFVSPRWSPDLAGWSLLVSTALFLSSAGLFVYHKWIRVQTN